MTFFLEVHDPSGNYLYSFRSRRTTEPELRHEARYLLSAEPKGSFVKCLRQDEPYGEATTVIEWTNVKELRA